jgi:TonB family protein
VGLDRARLKEIADDAWSTLRRRPRFTFLAGCLAVLLVSAWGTQRFADGLLSSLPSSTMLDAPKPMTEEEIRRQIEEARRINDELRAHRQAPAYSMQQSVEGLPDDPNILPMPDGAPPPPDAVGPGRGNGPDPNAYVATDERAEPIYTVKGEYPDIARQAGVEGTVVVQALVGLDGRVRDTRIVRSIPMLNGAAQEAVRQWRFKPAATGGGPVATWVSIPISFRR